MNEKIVEELLKYMNETKDFILSESPELIREILSYEKWSCIFLLSILLPLLIICLCLIVYNWIYPTLDKYESRTLGSMYLILIPSIISFVCFGILMEAGNSLIKINKAPKYFIIQKIININQEKNKCLK